MGKIVGTTVVSGFLLVSSSAISASWSLPDEPLRLNIGTIDSSKNKSLATTGLVDLLPTLSNQRVTEVQANLLGAQDIDSLELTWRAADAGETSERFLVSAPSCAPERDAKLI